MFLFSQIKEETEPFCAVMKMHVCTHAHRPDINPSHAASETSTPDRATENVTWTKINDILLLQLHQKESDDSLKLLLFSASSDSNISSSVSKAHAHISSCLLLVLLTLQAQWMILETAMWGNQSLADLQSHAELLFFTSEYHSDLWQIRGSAHIVL